MFHNYMYEAVHSVNEHNIDWLIIYMYKTVDSVAAHVFNSFSTCMKL